VAWSQIIPGSQGLGRCSFRRLN